MLELVNEGDLFTKLDPSGTGLPEATARKYMGQLASGLAFMHSKDIVHCDIKVSLFSPCNARRDVTRVRCM